MPDPQAFPAAEESYRHLHGAGWTLDEAGFTGASGQYIRQVDGCNGVHRIRLDGATPAEAWH